MSNSKKKLKNLKEACFGGAVMAIILGIMLVHKAIIPIISNMPGESFIPLWVLYITPIPIVISVVSLIYDFNKKALLSTGIRG